MEKLEEGMYVRTNDGYINKIEKSNQFNVLVDGRDLFGEVLNVPNKEIIKASYNIIDLIEAGDYVNEKKVTTINCIEPITNEKFIECYFGMDGTSFNWCYYNRDIKSIVTKEQFSSMEYKIDNLVEKVD